jgi:hypothetical protein
MSTREVIRAYGDLKMYRTSSGRYTIEYEDRCVRANLGPDDAYYLWESLTRKYGSRLAGAESGAEQLSLSRQYGADRSTQTNLNLGYDLGSGKHRVPARVLYPMEGAFEKKVPVERDPLRDRYSIRNIGRSRVFEEK